MDQELFTLLNQAIENPLLEHEATKLFVNQIRKGMHFDHDIPDKRTQKFIYQLSNFDKESIIVRERDYDFSYFGIKTLQYKYLIAEETPQDLYFRVAITLFDDPESIKKYYDALSLHEISNATPIFMNCGTKVQQLSSCFQYGIGDDVYDMYHVNTLGAVTSKESGGASFWGHSIRGYGSMINSTGGNTKGVRHVIRMLNDTQVHINQGGKRPGAFAFYLSIDHVDVITALAQCLPEVEASLHKVHSPDIKLALWVSDLFMKKMIAELTDKTAGDWYLFSPNDVPDLYLAYGDEYEMLYEKYVNENKYRKKIKCSQIMHAAFKLWTRAGIPYFMFKDNINRKSNMKNVAPIMSSNLCCEITIPSWSQHEAPNFAKFNKNNGDAETGVCNLGAICLESFLTKNNVINYSRLIDSSGLSCKGLNNIIDKTKYPDAQCERSNKRHRPIGIGIIGLADVFARKRIQYDSKEAEDIAFALAATIYYGALKESCELAKEHGQYSSYEGSPMSQGLLQPDLWDIDRDVWEVKLEELTNGVLTCKMWADLRLNIATYGVRNAYLIAYMPTATTGNIVGQNECFEPRTSNIYTRNTQSGEFLLVNKHMVDHLTELGLWSLKLYHEIIENDGSIQNISSIPNKIKPLYKTAREMSQKAIIHIVRAMSPFVCQSCSMNAYFDEPNLSKITGFLKYGWLSGLKTGLYYCHTAPASGGQKNNSVAAPANAPEVITDKTSVAACESCSC